jgi:hypothetical protein
MLHKYPHRAFPYGRLVEENRHRGKDQPEFELLDTGVFDDDRYFDVFVEYAKASPNDILMCVTVHNRGPEAATIHVLPQIWFRNTWSWKPDAEIQLKRNIRNSGFFGCIALANHDCSSATTKPTRADSMENLIRAAFSKTPFTNSW